MADDSMEISSDHGHIADDDIDIDIDFSAGGDGDGDNIGEEDYMVDDAPLDPGFGGGTSLDQALHSTDQDDFMLEDVAMFDEATGELKKPEEGTLLDVSISMQDGSFEQQQDHPVDLASSSFLMDGASYLNPGHSLDASMPSEDQLPESFEEENPTGLERGTSLNSGNDTLVYNQVSANIDAAAQIPTPGESSSVVENDDLHHTVQTDIMEESAPLDQGQDTETERTAQSALLTEASLDSSVKAVPAESAETVPTGTPISSPKESLDSEKEGLSVDQEVKPYDTPRSPPTSVHEDILPGRTSRDEDDTVKEDAANSNSLATSPDVVVTWKDIEYALFAKSEFDDPNTCFLFDLKLLHEPLTELLKSMRDVIHDDLSDDDELCVNISDIGLEFEETSTYIHEYTVGQIIDVFHKLLQNGGDSIRPLSMHVGVRTHFAKLYANCLSGAADGKFLRDVVKTIVESESPNEYPEEHEFTGGQTLDAEEDDQEAHEEENDDNVILAKNVSASEPILPAEHQGEYSSTNQFDESHIRTHDPKLDNNTALGVSENEATDNVNHAKVSPNGTVSISGAMSHVEEEDDLIDYSEDELEMAAEPEGDKPHAVSLDHENGPAQKGKEPKSIDEKLEENNNAQKNGSSGAHNEENDELETEFFGDANGENEEGEGDFENEIAKEGQNNETDEYDSTTQQKYLDEDVDHLEGQEFAVEGVATNPNQVVDADAANTGNGVLDDDELNFFEEDIDFGTTAHDRFEVKGDDQVDQQNDGQELYDTTGGIEFADPADSSATVSTGEPHAGDLDEYEFQTLAGTTQYDGELEEEFLDGSNTQNDVSHTAPLNQSEDEIDYDDEDDNQEPSVEIQPVGVANGSSKRPLSQVDADDATASRDQEHKRPRS